MQLREFVENQGDAMRRTKGFSLIELLIVVAIILIIAAVAVPSFLHSRLAANESSAVASIRTINTAMISYNSAYPTVGFAANLVNLGPGGLTSTCPTPPTSTTACLIDGLLASGTKNGYSFVATGTAGSYVAYGNPVSPSNTGVRSFCSFADAVVRVSLTTLSGCDGTVTPQQ
jgi:prepilin-type N-terminal cleavage/methylation domain-containing protein